MRAKQKTNGHRLTDLGLFALERTRASGDLIEAFKIVKALSGIRLESSASEPKEMEPLPSGESYSALLQQQSGKRMEQVV